MGDSEQDGAPLILRHAGRELPLRSGEWFIGRDADCLLRLDDPLISRRHAVISVGKGSVAISDLSSANGVYVNGQRVLERTQLFVGDKVLVGRQELQITRPGFHPAPRGQGAALHQLTLERLRSEPPAVRSDPSGPPSAPDATNRVDTFALMSTVLDRMLADGRVADAGRLLVPHLDALAKDVSRGKTVPDMVARRAAEYSIKVASASGKGEWLDRVVGLYSGLKLPIHEDIAAAFAEAATRAADFNKTLVRDYISAMRTKPGHLGMEARAALDKLEGATRGSLRS